jgi:ribosomal protein S18 acetylase RimI-like enzyme
VSGLTRPATAPELAWIAGPAIRAQLVADRAELLSISESEPWRVRVTEKGEAALLARWREQLDYCAVLGLWCSPRRVPLLVTDLLEVARAHGFGHLLGPLVPERSSRPYLDAGLRIVERVVVMRLDLRARAHALVQTAARQDEDPGAPAARATRVAGLTVRDAGPSDLAEILPIDDACFEPFWRYHRTGLERLARTGRLAVGTLDGRVVGYTLATSRAGEGSLGRLAVLPGVRRRGIGRALAEEAVDWMAGQGVRSAVLSTQEDNTASRSLYHAMGFAETGDVLVACASSSLMRETGEGR